MNRVAFTLGKFYPFHDGHKGLIDFMEAYPLHFNESIILVCGKPKKDLIPPYVRHQAVAEYTKESFVFLLDDDDMPDYPEEDVDFWAKWTYEVGGSLVDHVDELYLFTSEEYGEQFAKEIESRLDTVSKCIHIPYDYDRNTYNLSGTDIREDFVHHVNYVDNHIIKYLSKKIFFLGAESTGKTTITENLAAEYGVSAKLYPEYARGYLDIKGPKLTKQKFYEIIDGQMTLETLAEKSVDLFKIFDTNLLTTYGWAKLFYPKIAEDMAQKFNFYDMYAGDGSFVLLMPDDIPFEEDPLRYGVDKRQTDLEYWKNILNEFHIPYKVYREENNDKIFSVFDLEGMYK